MHMAFVYKRSGWSPTWHQEDPVQPFSKFFRQAPRLQHLTLSYEFCEFHKFEIANMFLTEVPARHLKTLCIKHSSMWRKDGKRIEFEEYKHFDFLALWKFKHERTA